VEIKVAIVLDAFMTISAGAALETSQLMRAFAVRTVIVRVSGKRRGARLNGLLNSPNLAVTSWGSWTENPLGNMAVQEAVHTGSHKSPYLDGQEPA
jgi:hypothetical protein